MIVNDKDAIERLNSPLNLINKIKENKHNGSAMALFTGNNGNRKSFLDNTPSPPSNPPSKQNESQASFNPFDKKTAIEQKTNGSSSGIVSASPQQLQSSPPEDHSEGVTLDNLINGNETQIKLGLAHETALTLLNNSLTLLTTKLDDVKADKLPGVIAAANKTVESIRRERLESSKVNKDRDVHYHFYTPTQRTMKDYEVIDVKGLPVDESPNHA